MGKLINNDTFTIKNQKDLEKVLQRLKDFANDEMYVKPQILTKREQNNLAKNKMLSKDFSNELSGYLKINYI